ncbi:C2H2 finger domain-containing protein [Histoplasma capsulatum var. duboisii H88]|uniref:C2H2 finger domain-containing protein n=1 Tax=Ajellomyces capsulatus (strain H88) TaxID=544711 RepID=F0U694_AJEC8|nr:C2H2 finger domain-containing protein [Histoplasma capsulatum var. duboisii H88]
MSKDIHNTFVLLEIIFNISLIFSSHIFLFSFLFHIKVFKNSSLQLMKNIQKLIFTDDCQKLLLSLKQKMNNWYIFCKVDIQNEQVHILYNIFMSMSTLDSQLKSMSKIYEFHNTFFFHQFCYNEGKLLDESEFVSDLQKNVIMNHTINYIFIIYYHIQHYISLQEIIQKQTVIDIEHQLSEFKSALDNKSAQKML